MDSGKQKNGTAARLSRMRIGSFRGPDPSDMVSSGIPAPKGGDGNSRRSEPPPVATPPGVENAEAAPRGGGVEVAAEKVGIGPVHCCASSIDGECRHEAIILWNIGRYATFFFFFSREARTKAKIRRNMPSPSHNADAVVCDPRGIRIPAHHTLAGSPLFWHD